MSLAEKLRKAREVKVEAGGFTFIVRRPTDVELIEIRATPRASSALLLPYVIGWEGVKEMDLIEGGDPHPLTFDAEVCYEWLSDRADLFGPIMEKIGEAVKEHAEKLKDAQKN